MDLTYVHCLVLMPATMNFFEVDKVKVGSEFFTSSSRELPKSYAGDGPNAATDGSQSCERPRPPPVPHSTTVTSPVQKTTVVVPKKG